MSDDGKFAVITVSQGTDQRTRLYYIFLGDNPKRPEINNPMVRLIDRLDAEYQFVGNIGDNFLVRTDLAAPKGRIVTIDINNELTFTRNPDYWLKDAPYWDGVQVLNLVDPAAQQSAFRSGQHPCHWTYAH